MTNKLLKWITSVFGFALCVMRFYFIVCKMIAFTFKDCVNLPIFRKPCSTVKFPFGFLLMNETGENSVRINMA